MLARDLRASDDSAAAPSALALFAILWGTAAVFHVLGPSGRSTGLVSDPTALGTTHAALAASGLWLIACPRGRLPLATVALLGLAAAWQEAPILGNHWWLASCVNVAILLALLIGSRGGGFDDERFRHAALPAARLCLLGFYPFAAFAKLNEAFFDTNVSCAAVFFDETAASYGFSTPIAVGADGLANLVPIATAATELTIPLLLLNRRTRSLGVFIGLVFHSVIALDQEHLFIDFSAVLLALFVLFLPAGFSRAATGLLADRARPYLIGWLLLVVGVLIVVWSHRSSPTEFTDVAGPMLAWFPADAALLLGVVLWLVRGKGVREARVWRPLRLPTPDRAVMVLVPVFVALNGLAPYLEVRTAFSYTMYANLRMVDGESNHVLVRSSLPVLERQEGLVTVIRTDDPGLRPYVRNGYALPWDSFRAYVADHPGTTVRFERNGTTTTLGPGERERARLGAPPLLVEKFLPLRAVDQRDPPRCQDSFLRAL